MKILITENQHRILYETIKENPDDFSILDKKNIIDDEYFLKKYDLKYLLIQNKYGLLELSILASKIIGSGSGTRLLKDLIAYADKVGKPITVNPIPYKKDNLKHSYLNQDVTPITKSRLIQYYKKFGFEKKKKNDGYITNDPFIRYPRKVNEVYLREGVYYRGGDMDNNGWYKWITPYEDHASEYGNVTKFEINLDNKNIADPYEAYDLANEYNEDCDPEDLLYNPDFEFVEYLINNEYDGYAIDPDYKNVLIFKTIFDEIKLI